MRLPLVLVLAVAAAGCGASPEPAPRPAPAPQPPYIGIEPPTVGYAPPAIGPIRICILRDGQIAQIDATYNAVTADTLVDGLPLSQLYPATSPPYAEGVDWYVRGDPVRIAGRRLMRYGLPRELSPGEVRPVGQYRGLVLYADTADDAAHPAVVYLFVRPGCQFQPYQIDYHAGAVRGR